MARGLLSLLLILGYSSGSPQYWAVFNGEGFYCDLPGEGEDYETYEPRELWPEPSWRITKLRLWQNEECSQNSFWSMLVDSGSMPAASDHETWVPYNAMTPGDNDAQWRSDMAPMRGPYAGEPHYLGAKFEQGYDVKCISIKQGQDDCTTSFTDCDGTTKYGWHWTPTVVLKSSPDGENWTEVERWHNVPCGVETNLRVGVANAVVTNNPTPAPSPPASPTSEPSARPTSGPSASPTSEPSSRPATSEPTARPTTSEPTARPTTSEPSATTRLGVGAALPEKEPSTTLLVVISSVVALVCLGLGLQLFLTCRKVSNLQKKLHDKIVEGDDPPAAIPRPLEEDDDEPARPAQPTRPPEAEDELGPARPQVSELFVESDEFQMSRSYPRRAAARDGEPSALSVTVPRRAGEPSVLSMTLPSIPNVSSSIYDLGNAPVDTSVRRRLYDLRNGPVSSGEGSGIYDMGNGPVLSVHDESPVVTPRATNASQGLDSPIVGAGRTELSRVGAGRTELSWLTIQKTDTKPATSGRPFGEPTLPSPTAVSRVEGQERLSCLEEESSRESSAEILGASALTFLSLRGNVENEESWEKTGDGVPRDSLVFQEAGSRPGSPSVEVFVDEKTRTRWSDG